jgi:hypothetical protein
MDNREATTRTTGVKIDRKAESGCTCSLSSGGHRP